jgi:hypothetical protein
MGVSPMLRVLPHIGGIARIQQDRGDLSIRRKERSALADSIGVPIEIAEYRDHGRDAHATKYLRQQTAISGSTANYILDFGHLLK